jgi:hypothetical protein
LFEFIQETDSTIKSVNASIRKVIVEMEQDRSQEMKCIVQTVRSIADEYTFMGGSISSMMEKAKLKVENIEDAAKLADPQDTISEIKYNLDSLTQMTVSVLKDHADIINRLGYEKLRADLVKDENIRQVQKFQEEAAYYKRWGSPLQNSRHLAKIYSDKALAIIEPDGNKISIQFTKGLASAGGYMVATVAVVLAPLFWAIATVLQKRSEKWSQKFLDISKQIYSMTISIRGVHSVLQSIRACIMEMDETVERYESHVGPAIKAHQIAMIQKSCERLKLKFNEYEQIPMQADNH